MKSGCILTFEEGEYRVWLRAVNEDAWLKKGKQHKFTESKSLIFTVLPESPVVKPADPAEIITVI